MRIIDTVRHPKRDWLPGTSENARSNPLPDFLAPKQTTSSQRQRTVQWVFYVWDLPIMVGRNTVNSPDSFIERNTRKWFGGTDIAALIGEPQYGSMAETNLEHKPKKRRIDKDMTGFAMGQTQQSAIQDSYVLGWLNGVSSLLLSRALASSYLSQESRKKADTTHGSGDDVATSRLGTLAVLELRIDILQEAIDGGCELNIIFIVSLFDLGARLGFIFITGVTRFEEPRLV
uniref:Uncharacterized protein n=1 Tax=Timema poppense TaxID=170557 RepID=A0A7R9D0B3_TIMPO|nr:unnamed protein product [Timema poppensis]